MPSQSMMPSSGTPGTPGMPSQSAMPGMDGMAGMMSPEDMTALQNAQGVEASKLFLTQMIQHHQTGYHDGSERNQYRSIPGGHCAGSLYRQLPAAGDQHHAGHLGLAVGRSTRPQGRVPRHRTASDGRIVLTRAAAPRRSR
jgi:hypothetical protein